MIQVIYEDGTKERFTKNIIERSGKKIKHQKILEKNEILKIPDIQNKKLIMREKTQEEIDSENEIIQQEQNEMLKWKKIKLKTRIDAGISLNIDMSAEEAELISLGIVASK